MIYCDKRCGMRLKKIADIKSGYLNRGKIEPLEDGSHYLIQARDGDAAQLTCRTDALIRFNPHLSPSDCILKSGDILFMARGSRNYAFLLSACPKPALAAASFFVIRLLSDKVLPVYVSWYLNQDIVQQYLQRYSGRGVHMPVVRRSVLENVEFPLPELETQKKIAELDSLMCCEQNLLERLAAKRRELILAACLKASQI